VESFSRDLLQFVTSIDHISGGAYSRLVRFFRSYVETVLEAGFYEIQLDGVKATAEGRDREGLGTEKEWSNGSEQVTPVRTSTGDYTGQTTYAYAEGVNLWITAKNKGPLRDVADTNDFVDSWSNRTDIPRYWNYAEQEKGLIARTSIILPLRHPGSRATKLGFLNLEFAKHLPARPQAKKELQGIADAIGTILHLRKTREHRIQKIDESISDINYRLENKRYPSPLLRSKLFLAYAKETDNQVMEIVRSVLATYDNSVLKVDWSADMKRPGMVNSQIDAEILESAFGVCLVSEPNEESAALRKGDKTCKYRDNPNVLIEAGMMHAFTLSSAPMSGWILIRERSSPRIPFDFVVHRRIDIPRNRDSKLNKERFASELKSQLDAMIAPS
jgi:hypothetical protein